MSIDTFPGLYMVFVGGTDILGWTQHGTETDTYITGLSLPLTDIKTKSPVYYVSMKAENGAGQESSVNIYHLSYFLHTTLNKVCKYSQTCIKRSPLGKRKSRFIRQRDLLKEVQFI
jgi:hypothetical protein